MQQLAGAGLSRIHVGLESGDDTVLRLVCKGTNRRQQIEAGQLVMEVGIENSGGLMIDENGFEEAPNCETCDDEQLIYCPRCHGGKIEPGENPDGVACRLCLGSGCVICPDCRNKNNDNPWE